VNVLKTIASSKFRLTLAALAAVMVVTAGATFGSWAVGSDSGNGYAKAVTAKNLTLSDASASTVADLYPGASGDVKLKVTNPNDFAVTITGIAGDGTITSDQGTACDDSTGVSFADTTGLSLNLAASATTVFTLTGKAAMSNTSDTTCQGAVFAIPVVLTATS
jgi:hypothetical protein